MVVSVMRYIHDIASMVHTPSFIPSLCAKCLLICFVAERVSQWALPAGTITQNISRPDSGSTGQSIVPHVFIS